MDKMTFWAAIRENPLNLLPWFPGLAWISSGGESPAPESTPVATVEQLEKTLGGSGIAIALLIGYALYKGKI